ncbi:MAG TPA: ATP-binding protein, partial [Chitinophagaceae bacterium]
ETSVWRYKPGKGEQGAQIDLLIDRQDRCINVCEMKFSAAEFEISKSYAKEMENKLRVFRANTKTPKTLFLTLVTTYGVKNARSYAGLVQNEITMSALFKA